MADSATLTHSLPFCPAVSTERILNSCILIIEDDAVSRMILVESLRKYGFNRIECVASGDAALQKLTVCKPDLVVLDLLLPGMDGFVLCVEMQKLAALRNVPVLVHTGLENEPVRLSIFEMGASDIVRKPVNNEELIARCRIHLEKRYILKDLEDYQSRMEDDLAHARAMQNLLMPDQTSIANAENFYSLEIQSLFSPSFTIGGDFWGIRPLTPDKLAFYIGDFTGHGVTAAINVFRLCTLIDKLPPAVLSRPTSCLTQLNRQLFALLPRELFATMFYAVWDKGRDTLDYCMAGCPPPLLLALHPATFRLLEGTGLPLAAISSPNYHEYSVPFTSGDVLLLYSDALIETPDGDNKHLSIEEVGKNLASIASQERTAAHLLQSVLSQFHTYASRGLQDDLTLNIYVNRS